MQNFIKTIINAVQVWTSKKIKDSTGDWNQNDPNADNYVKNRTHWEEEAVIIAEREISGFSLMQEPLYAVENPFRMSPVVGSTYTVVWDGVSYDVKMQSFDGLGYIGNVNYVNMASGGNIPFAIVFAEDVFLVTESPAASHTISISGAVVHKLDSKYLDLPTNLATTDDVQEAVDVANEAHNIANSKMKANNPVGTGSFSMNRKSGTTIGDFSHAEGRNTTASGSNSHAEGYYTTASGSNSHAEGNKTTASGSNSHAEGWSTEASGFDSHAEGSGTRAIGDSSHAEGRYNIPDTTDTYVHIVGNGESDTARSNAHSLDWDGNAWYAGDVYVGSTSGTNKDEGSKKLATEEYVDTALEDLSTSGGFVVQAEPPEDKNVLWVDPDDNTEEDGSGGDSAWNLIYELEVAEELAQIDDRTIDASKGEYLLTIFVPTVETQINVANNNLFGQRGIAANNVFAATTGTRLHTTYMKKISATEALFICDSAEKSTGFDDLWKRTRTNCVVYGGFNNTFGLYIQNTVPAGTHIKLYAK